MKAHWSNSKRHHQLKRSRGWGRENGLILLSLSCCLNASALTPCCRYTDAAAEPHGKGVAETLGCV